MTASADKKAPPTFKTILYDVPRSKVVRITLNRPESRNAQNYELLYELNDAFNRALYDDAVKVIILAADGKHFSAGHDIAGTVEEYMDAMQAHPRKVGHWSGFTEEATAAQEPAVARP